MRILLFGKNGQLGWELQRSLAPLGEVVALGTQDLPCGDFTRPARIADTARSLCPDVIVNAAAYTAVDKAEADMEAAETINASTPGLLAEVASELGAWLVHFSTDYVFDGTGTAPWREDDRATPVNAYGRSKLRGEENIRNAGGKHLIFRTSWLYAARGANFAKTMLRLAQERDELRIIDDQFGAPTGADLLADVAAHALRASMREPAQGGTYHVAAAGETTWYGYARHVISQARSLGADIRVADERIVAVPTTAYPTPAQRPSNSRLDTQKLRSTFDLHMPGWQAGVDRMLTEILQK